MCGSEWHMRRPAPKACAPEAPQKNLTTADPAATLRVDYFQGCADPRKRFRELAKTLHPDAGGDPEAFLELVRQRDSYDDEDLFDLMD